MIKQSRREFLKTSALLTAAATGLSTKPAKAAPSKQLSKDRFGVLVDTTVCVGCRRCEWACKIAHNIEAGDLELYNNREVFNTKRRPEHNAFTVVNEYKINLDNAVDVKVQCMHCDEPACVSACIVGAFEKRESGAVVWNESKCIGCRYCMVACPFQIPTFEYHKAIEPEIKKCDFCYTKIEKGELPACVEICPMEALTFGNREDLIFAAKQKIKNYPDRYYNKILGESVVGGTSWLYLAPVEFEKLDFPKLGDKPAPGVSESIQHGIFAYFVPPIAIYALLGGIMWLTKNKDDKKE